MKLLTTGNPKTVKGEGEGYLTAILHLAPFDLSGHNVCPWASKGCAAACLNTAGRGGIFRNGETTNAIQEARKRRTRMFFGDRPAFLAQLAREMRAHVKRAERHGLKPAVRLNGTSDLRWEKLAPELFAEFSDVAFYDYTKGVPRMVDYLAGRFPVNYSLTFSRSESNHAQAIEVLEAGGNVAVVFDTKRGRDLPELWKGFEVIDGDATDLRFLDPKPVREHIDIGAESVELVADGAVVGLRAKGRARNDLSGFVVHDTTATTSTKEIPQWQSYFDR